MRFWLLLLLITGARGVRIPLDIDARSSPFLQSTISRSQSNVPLIVTAPFTWSHMYLGKLLHQARVIELGPRGALFVASSSHTASLGITPSTVCKASDKALCATADGEEVLPSALLNDGTAAPSVFDVDSAHDKEEEEEDNSVLSILARLKDACKLEGNGGGRVYADADSDSRGRRRMNYTVTACDVLQGTHVLVYEPRARRLSLRTQTFGPAAYLITLLSATMHIAALAQSEAEKLDWVFPCNCMLSIVACAVLSLKGDVRFYTIEDTVLFWAAAAGGCITLLMHSSPKRAAYLFALSLMATALYRTHETPYAGVLGYVFGYRVWAQMLKGKPEERWETLAMLAYTSLFCEIAIKPGYAQQGGLWRLQFIFHAFITYCLAKFRELSGSSSSSSAA